MLTINKSKVMDINVGGRGGKEAVLMPLFNESLERVSAALYDAVTPCGEKLEFKKKVISQKNRKYMILRIGHDHILKTKH